MAGRLPPIPSCLMIFAGPFSLCCFFRILHKIVFTARKLTMDWTKLYLLIAHYIQDKTQQNGILLAKSSNKIVFIYGK